MRDDLERLLDDITLVTLALAIAVGYALFQFAHGVAVLVDGAATHLPSGDLFGGVSGYGLTWQVGHHLLSFDSLVVGAIELVVALAAAVWVARRSSGD